DPKDPTNLHITFPRSADSQDQNGNGAWAVVDVSATTDIGEWLHEGIEVDSWCRVDRSQLPDVRVLQRLHRPEIDGMLARGFPRLYESETDSLIARVMQSKHYNLDEVPRHLSATDREWVNAYMKWRMGQQLS